MICTRKLCDVNSEFIIDNYIVSDKQTIVNTLIDCYFNMGPGLAAKIVNTSSKNAAYYLQERNSNYNIHNYCK